jgi:hypothetical protein
MVGLEITTHDKELERGWCHGFRWNQESHILPKMCTKCHTQNILVVALYKSTNGIFYKP